jgi:hypothetical protein
VTSMVSWYQKFPYLSNMIAVLRSVVKPEILDQLGVDGNKRSESQNPWINWRRAAESINSSPDGWDFQRLSMNLFNHKADDQGNNKTKITYEQIDAFLSMWCL